MDNRNKGFSLIEMLVAVVLLAMAVIPLALSFTSSAQINSKAINTGKAIDISNSILDTAQAVPLHNILAEINGYNLDAKGNDIYIPGISGYSLINDSLRGYNVNGYNEVKKAYYCSRDKKYMEYAVCSVCNAILTEDDVCYLSDESGKKSSVFTTTVDGVPLTKLQESNNGNYYIMMNDIQTESASFDAIIEYEKIRSKEIADLNNRGFDNHISFRFDKKEDTDMAKMFYELNKDEYPDRTADWYYENMIRKTIIEITAHGTTVNLLLTNDYYAIPDATMLGKNWLQSKVLLRDSYELSELKNGFFLFFPGMKDRDDVVRNYINIDNKSIVLSNLGFPLYLIPQAEGEKPHIIASFNSDALIDNHPIIQVYSTVAKDKLIFTNGDTGESLQMWIASTQETDYRVKVKIFDHKESAMKHNDADGYNYFIPQGKNQITSMECMIHN